MRYASVTSGVEAATQAWHPLGWKAAWFSQYDPEHDYKKGPDFASRYLSHTYPHIPNLGDMLKLREHDIYRDEPFDLLVGGTPCQDFSIAGLRAGLDGERGNLSLEFARILRDKRYQQGSETKKLRWFLWENVPGVLSSKKGADFANILSAFTGLDIEPQKFTRGGVIAGKEYSVAWRILDARYFGVPQRRRRLFVVGYIGNDWRPPFAVLFERESLYRDFTPGSEERKSAARKTDERITKSSRGFRMTAFGEYADDESASALKKRDYKDATDLIIQPAIGIHGNIVGRDDKNGGNQMGLKEEEAPTLTKADRHAVAAPLVFKIRGGKEGGGKGYLGVEEEEEEEEAFTIATSGNDMHLLQPMRYGPSQQDTMHFANGVMSPLVKASNGSSPHFTKVYTGYMLRRLTPLECERLQGFPDDATDIPGATDTKRYEVMGNSMAVPVMHWIGKRIDAVDKLITKPVIERTSLADKILCSFLKLIFKTK